MGLPSFFTDFLQSYSFWLFDVAPIDSFGLPLFTPLFGFSRASSPEVTLTTQAIKEGNWHYTRKVITGATVSPIVLERGVFWLDSDFWRWTQAAIFGDPQMSNRVTQIPGPSIRRNILLIHFFSRGPIGAHPPQPVSSRDGATTTFSDPSFTLAKVINSSIGAAGLLGLDALSLGLSGEGIFSTAGVELAATTAAFGVSNALSPGNGNSIRIPAKAWLLYDCLPIRYKAASDFDAGSSAISLQELELEYERFEEIALAS